MACFGIKPIRSVGVWDISIMRLPKANGEKDPDGREVLVVDNDRSKKNRLHVDYPTYFAWKDTVAFENENLVPKIVQNAVLVEYRKLRSNLREFHKQRRKNAKL